ncbi:2-hydroxyacyl-CoA dehydratase family protein [Pseudonocardia sp. NPDC049154]|uniref:2-hydroxyacyl-CoA dehydratase subunit D n=1 Tax=Pseudonocardia sp. NPDC049154 TaxID=3155501 RepID=UPI0034029AF6
MGDAVSPLERMAEAADDPAGYAARWKARTGSPAVGVLPMNFPAEIAHAAGVLPVVVQEDRNPITLGNNLLSEFNCGYSRNLADQAATGRLDVFDAVFMADHCIQLIGAADVIRELSDRPFHFGQLISSMNDPWTPEQVRLTLAGFVEEMSAFAGVEVTEERLGRSIRAYNRGRRLLRRLYTDRRDGDARFGPTELQTIVKSSMVMQREEHTALLEELVAASVPGARDGGRVRVHLSAHLCHAPKPELLELIEESGGLVVDDDLFHGVRHVSTDADEDRPPLDALVSQYLRRNVAVPCPTRAQSDVDWDSYLVDAVRRSGAEAVISLMVKYCEPHMLYLPEVRKRLDAEGVPHLLLETEHEGMPLETMRTRIEAMFEQVRLGRTRTHAASA